MCVVDLFSNKSWIKIMGDPTTSVRWEANWLVNLFLNATKPKTNSVQVFQLGNSMLRVLTLGEAYQSTT